MPDLVSRLLDPYSRKARFQPVVLSLLPIVVAFVLLAPEYQLAWTDLGWLLVGCGGPTFLAQLGRGRGKALEPTLYRAWGGKPSVAMLRHRDTKLSVSTKARYRDFLERTVPGLELATPDNERRCPEQADDGYDGATSWLLSQTTDREKFALLFEENINYGFRRNVWGLKPWALVSGLVSIGMVLGFTSDAWSGGIVGTLSALDIFGWLTMVTAAAHMMVFAFVVRRDWVRVAADAYAQQLLASCDTLEGQRA